MEVWIDAYEFPNWEVSSHGQVRNKKKGNILKQHTDKDGYSKLSLGNTNNVSVHRLVAKSFYGEPEPGKDCVNHINANRSDNSVFNLEWVSPKENVKWGVYKGNIKPQIGLNKAIEANKKRIRINELNKEFDSVKECGEYLNVPSTHISSYIRGKKKYSKLKDYTFEYIEGSV